MTTYEKIRITIIILTSVYSILSDIRVKARPGQALLGIAFCIFLWPLVLITMIYGIIKEKEILGYRFGKEEGRWK